MSQSAIAQRKAEIKDLMKQKEWRKAHRLCLEVLRYAPENMKFIRLKNKIEKKVKKLNVQAIKKDLKLLEPLWKEERYKEILEYLKHLEPYIGQYPRLARIIIEAQEAYRQQILQEEKSTEREAMKRITQLRHKKNYREAIEEVNHLLNKNPRERSFRTLQHSLQKEWVNDELQKNKELLKSKKSKEKLDFLQKLHTIDPGSQRIKLQIVAVRSEYEKSENKEQRAVIEEAFQKVHTLFKAKKYDEALAAAEHLLKIAPKNARVQTLVRKLHKKVIRVTKKEVMQQMKKTHQSMKKSIKELPREERKKEYIKV